MALLSPVLKQFLYKLSSTHYRTVFFCFKQVQFASIPTKATHNWQSPSTRYTSTSHFPNMALRDAAIGPISNPCGLIRTRDERNI
ncbi:hypothetical protein CR513_13122, partial [Mucuna pruriens]